MLYREWFPQIVYNHHQTGPAGTVMFSPPFRDPFNYNFDPLVVNELDQVGAAMHTRFDAEGKPGVTMRSGANYSTWWNGGLRTTAYFHNMIGLLTETIGNPTPETIAVRAGPQLPRSGDLPFPIAPQEWHFRQSIDYSITANRAVLDFASRYREKLLYNIYLMGRNSIERGSTDTWTMYPTPRRGGEGGRSRRTKAAPTHGDARMVGRRPPQGRRRRKYYDAAAQARRTAIRAATSSRRTRPTSSTATSSSTSLIKTGVDGAPRDRAVHGRAASSIRRARTS